MLNGTTNDIVAHRGTRHNIIITLHKSLFVMKIEKQKNDI